jgi:3-deoxy-D-manno-octulosonate 8-phosphate phosphatase (KDO 8-P phosphatase)
MLSSPSELAARCEPIELLVLDVDGVLTDGVIALDSHGVETKHFHVRDGSALALWQKSGRRVAILSGRRAAAVEHRAAELGITAVVQGAAEKQGPFQALIAGLGFEAQRVCYMGDDLADLPILAAAGLGLAACPADAAAEVRDSVHLITQTGGGRGAVRELVEIILKHQGAWKGLVAPFLAAG